MFCCEFCKIFKNNVSYRTPVVVASNISKAKLSSNLFTAWKVFKYGVFSGPYFPVFELNTKIYSANLRIQFEFRKVRTRGNCVFGHFFTKCMVSLIYIILCLFFLLFFFWLVNPYMIRVSTRCIIRTSANLRTYTIG